jgi:DNA-directed RNA polymerase sigma subunit (sigma70/sigma32)
VPSRRRCWSAATPTACRARASSRRWPSLDARSRRIIEARWLRDESEGGTLTLHDLADEFGVSAERIRQIEVKAMQKMKGSLARYA